MIYFLLLLTDNKVSDKLLICPIEIKFFDFSSISLLDRLVLLGNHRDSWTYGAGDASSGQAALLEIGRAMGEMKKKGN